MRLKSDHPARINRREFLKLGGLVLSGAAINPFTPFFPYPADQPPQDLVRVAYPAVSVYKASEMDAAYVRDRYRDELVNVYYPFTPLTGPAYNPLWYRVWGGYMHSAYLQPVEIAFNRVMQNIRTTGQLAEVTVPYTRAYQFSEANGWEPVNRLYFQSTHWITGVGEGPDGDTWYRFTDELQPVDYHAPAMHFRPIPDEELAPLSPDLPFEAKRIEVSLQAQTLTAFEHDQPVFFTKVSTGISSTGASPSGIPTQTPTGRFNIFSKMPSKHMGNARLTDNLEDYVLMGVPWTSFFVDTGVAFHGTYWHNNYGWPMSRGCVNMRPRDAKWLFRWATPVNDPADWEKRGYGTRVDVI